MHGIGENDPDMAINPEEVRTKTFPIIRKGYEQGAVHRYLDAVASELESFNRQVAADNEIVVADVVEESAVEDATIVTTEVPKIEEPAMTATVPSQRR